MGVGVGLGGNVEVVTGGVACTPPSFTSAPVSSAPNGMLLGEPVGVTWGTYVGSAVVVTVQWYRDGVAIPGATSNIYTLTAADIGPEIIPRVTLTGACGVVSADGATLQYDPLTEWSRVGDVAMIHDYADAATIGADIDSIPDASGNGNTLSAAGLAQRPLFTAASAPFNNQPTGLYDGGAETLRRAVVAMGGTLGSPGTLLFVCRLAGNINGRVPLSLNNVGARFAEVTGGRLTTSWTPSGAVVSPTDYTLAAHNAAAVTDGAQLSYVEDGVSVGTPLAYVASVADGVPYAHGAASNGAAFSNVEIAYAAALRFELAGNQLATWVVYGQNRWGLP